MKISITSFKNSLVLCSLLMMPSLAFAKLVGKVHQVKGEAFMMLDGKTQRVVVNMDIADGAQLIISDDAQITVGDFYDRRYHLMAGSHFVMNDQSHVLHKGGVWSQAKATKTRVSMATANLLLNAYQAEYVVTYDNASKKGQLSVINGEVDAASPMEPAFRYAVMAGQFTFAQPDLEEGYPRSPTKLGYDSLMKTVAQFPGVKSWDAGVAEAQVKLDKKSTTRSIASVSESDSAPAKGQITFMKTYLSAERAPASVSGEAQSYFVKQTKKKPIKGTEAKVRVIGFQSVKASSARNPASSRKVQSKAAESSVKDSDFLKSYELHQRQQPQHSKEVQRLIDDLKSH